MVATVDSIQSGSKGLTEASDFTMCLWKLSGNELLAKSKLAVVLVLPLFYRRNRRRNLIRMSEMGFGFT